MLSIDLIDVITSKIFQEKIYISWLGTWTSNLLLSVEVCYHSTTQAIHMLDFCQILQHYGLGFPQGLPPWFPMPCNHPFNFSIFSFNSYLEHRAATSVFHSVLSVANLRAPCQVLPTRPNSLFIDQKATSTDIYCGCHISGERFLCLNPKFWRGTTETFTW